MKRAIIISVLLHSLLVFFMGFSDARSTKVRGPYVQVTTYYPHESQSSLPSSSPASPKSKRSAQSSQAVTQSNGQESQSTQTVNFTSPELLARSLPSYPVDARKAHWEGTVVVRAFVNSNGAVETTQILKSSQHPVLDDSALKFVSESVFSPALEDGKPVASQKDLEFEFKLK